MDLVGALRAIVGERHVLVDDDVRAGYEVDWTGRFRGSTPAVVRPGSTAEVAAVVEGCAEAGAPLVAQGGNTGLVGGSVPLAGEVVLSTRRLDRLEPVSAGLVVAGAGVTLAALQGHVAAAGWGFGVDLAARGSATVGGMIATDAAGLRHLRYGSMRRQLRGVEAVLGDGSVVAGLEGPPKTGGGYDLAALLAGSEGTLGIVTAARLSLVPPPRRLVTALVGVGSFGAGLAAVGAMRHAGADLLSAEGFCEEGMALVCGHLGVGPPVARRPVYLLLEWDGEPDELAAAGDVADAVVATDAAPRAALWRFRDSLSEAVNRVGVPHKLDVGVDPALLDELVAATRSAVASVDPAWRVVPFGHVADGNLHLNVLGPRPDDERVDDAVLRLVAGLGGSISAEHGVGRAKARWLPLVRSQAELSAWRALRAAFDPAGILNPGVLSPTPAGSPGRP